MKCNSLRVSTIEIPKYKYIIPSLFLYINFGKVSSQKAAGIHC